MKRMSGVLLALALCMPTYAYGSESEIQELREQIAVLEYRIEVLEEMVMNGTSADLGEAESTELTEEQKMDADFLAERVNTKLESEEFAAWQELYKEFTGSNPGTPEVTHAMRYEIEDFEGVKVDCYLINVSADVGYWVNEEAQQGAVGESVQLLIDTKTLKNYDNITTKAGMEQPDTTTEMGRAMYLLGIYGNLQNGSFSGNFLNDTEIITELTSAELEVINSNMK